MSTVFEKHILKYVKSACFAAIAVMAVVALPVQAADAPAADQAAPAPAPIVEQPAAAVRPVAARSASDIMTLNFTTDMSVRQALSYLGQTYQKNIIPSSKVDGAVTVSNLRDVTFDQAMKAILGNRYAYEPSDGDIYVYTVDELKTIKEDPKRLQTRVFTLSYISAEDAKLFLEPIASSTVTCMECKIVASKTATTTSSGGATGGGTEAKLTASTSGIKDASNDMLVIKDYPEKLDAIDIRLKEIDVRPQQVLVEATILAVTLDENTQLGIDWNTLQGVAISTLAGVHASGGGFGSTGVSTLTDAPATYSIGVTRDNVTAIINAIESITDTTVLANPKILTMNKQRGQVFTGSERGYYSATTFVSGSDQQQRTVEQLKTGTSLEFTPYIGTDGYIRMDIFPEDSDGYISGGLPVKTSTSVTTNVMVKDGQTVIIGGLIRTVTTTSKRQVPLLGDLPLIGIVFRGSSDSTKKQEVVVMLTPHIIKTPSDVAADEALKDVENKSEGANKQMQWFSRSRIAEDHYQNAMKAYNSGDMVKALSEVNKSLDIRPTYTEALRLQKKLQAQAASSAGASVEKVMQEAL